MVAAVCSWHQFHVAAAAEMNRRLGRRESLAIAAPALMEAYSVLTRLPAAHRLSPADAAVALRENFVKQGRIVALHGTAYVQLLQSLSDVGISGGQVYDAVIAACAIKAKAQVLLTFNEADFVPFCNESLSVVLPRA
jgi:predicted nucleic acid-binding protein